MILLENFSGDAAFSLAAEEYILSTYTSGEYLMLWRNTPSVIIGKFQNPFAEVSLLACEKSGVPVYRRNSGGGTVYHDLGNLNYTIVADRSESSPDYARFLMPIIRYLATLGVNAEIRDTSALFVGKEKISGNAQTVVGNRVMHHGTLVFDVNLSALSSLTGHAREKITSKAIRSNPSPVVNIRSLLKHDMTIDDFVVGLADFLTYEKRSFSATETAEIQAIADHKYRTWEWNYGRTNAFSLVSDSFSLTASHGVIESASRYSNLLVGTRLIPAALADALSSLKDEEVEWLLNQVFL